MQAWPAGIIASGFMEPSAEPTPSVDSNVCPHCGRPVDIDDGDKT